MVPNFLSKANDFCSRYRVVFYILCIAGVIWFINDWRDLRKESAARAAVDATFAEKFAIIDGVSKAQNTLLESTKKQSETIAAFGQAFADTMKGQNQVLLAIAQSVGRVEGKVTTGTVTNTSVSGTVAKADLVQNRETRPSLTTAQVTVNTLDPKNPKWGVTWLNNPETFKVNFGMFKRGSGAGELTAYTTLSREVSRLDGTFLGKEEITLGESVMKLDPSFVSNSTGVAKLDIPRLGIFVGAGWDPLKGKWTPAGGADYRVTDRLSVLGGYVNNGPFVGGRFNFNLK